MGKEVNVAGDGLLIAFDTSRALFDVLWRFEMRFII